ncbi:MAG: nucleoside triphosphate pyrophosphohydrolase [Alkalinema sp. RL_2_19]|nr:nucleoside triphosphate pyrophosphohydrolase [Alkalinema sp. RL_2_19]
MSIQPDFPASEAATLQALQQLIAVVAQLRNPDGGCPWDLQQTARSLTPYMIEEAYETVHAIQSGDQAEIADELGDLLLQIVLQAQVAKDAQQFDLAWVAQRITAKMIRRHPHVFGEAEAVDADAVNRNWEQIKAQEKGVDPATQTLSAQLSHKAKSLPALEAGMKISQKAAKAGFEWETVEGVWDKFHEELGEFRQALAHETKAEQTAEFGDVMFSLLQLARWHDIDPSEALSGTNQRFIQRLQKMEQVADRPLEDYSLAELETLWQQAKLKLGQGSNAG